MTFHLLLNDPRTSVSEYDNTTDMNHVQKKVIILKPLSYDYKQRVEDST